MAGEEVGFGGVRVAGQDEGLYAQVGVRRELGQHLVGVADDGRARPGAGAADAGPQVRLGIAVVVGAVAQLGLRGAHRSTWRPGSAVRIASPVASSSREPGAGRRPVPPPRSRARRRGRGSRSSVAAVTGGPGPHVG